jgi:Lrp/AsnC family transcriptional regulator for asnA, asnC and gidA
MTEQTVELSESDIKIIQCLQKDPRSSVAHIGETLGMPTSSVRHRLQRLIKDGVIEFDVMTNPLVLGYQVWTMIEIQVDIAQIESVAQQLARCPEVYLVYIMAGRYDILVGTAFRTNEEFLEFITGTLAKFPGIMRTTSSRILRLNKRSMNFPLPQTLDRPRRAKAEPKAVATVPVVSEQTVELSDADVKIIQCLQKDPRSSVAHIGEMLGMPTSSVRHRLQRLIKEGVIKFDVMTNPFVLGYQVWTMIEIQVDIAQIEAVAQQLARCPEVYLVYIMAGRYDILVGTVFRTSEEFLEFITGKLAKFPGITRTTSSSVLRLDKRSMNFPLPQTLGRADDENAETETKAEKKAAPEAGKTV